jgi:hypothetical protein
LIYRVGGRLHPGTWVVGRFFIIILPGNTVGLKFAKRQTQSQQKPLPFEKLKNFCHSKALTGFAQMCSLA